MRKRLRDLLERLLADPEGRRLLGGALAAAAVLLWFEPALAAGGGHGGHGDPHVNWFGWDAHTPPVGWLIVDFVIFIGGLVYFTKKPLKAMLQKRHDDFKAALEDSQASLKKAEAHRQEYQTKLARVDEEVKTLLDGATDDGNSEKQKIVAQAQAYAKTLRSDSDDAADLEVEAARTRLRIELVEKVLAKATAKVTETLVEDDRKRLLEEAIKELETGRSAVTQGGAA